MKDIRKGQEIFFDYSISAIPIGHPIHGSNFSWKMKCQCKSKNCRKIVEGDFFKLPKELQIKYLPYLDSWFKNKVWDRLRKLK